MTVKELIDILTTHDPDEQIFLRIPKYQSFCSPVIKVASWETLGADNITVIIA